MCGFSLPLVFLIRQRRQRQVIKLARQFQERNRAAAKRCRDRKNEKLNFLEGEVSTLKEKKARLIDEQNNLKSELQSLQQRYNSHVGSNQPECAYNSPLPVCDFKQLWSFNKKLPLICSLLMLMWYKSSYEIQFIKNKRVTKIKLFSTEKWSKVEFFFIFFLWINNFTSWKRTLTCLQ